MNKIPRRIDINRYVPAETAIREAILRVEEMPADVRLTEAVVLLGRAKDKVADFVDGNIDLAGHLNIYLVSQTKCTGYDVYDSFVIVAESEDDARDRHPQTCSKIDWVAKTHGDDKNNGWNIGGEWPDNRDDVHVRLIGVAGPFVGPGILCASFNAG